MRHRSKLYRLLLVLAVLLAIGCMSAIAKSWASSPQTKEGEFDPVSKNNSSAIPPIDADAPGHYETMSFGLG